MAKREISAGFVIYRRTKEGPEFLLLYHGGRYWNFPKGKIESEEKSMQAAIRETREETGIRVGDLKIRKGFRAHEHYTFISREREKINKTVIFYLAETRKGAICVNGKRERGCGWFLYPEAHRLLKSHKDSEALLKQAKDFINRPRSTASRPTRQIRSRSLSPRSGKRKPQSRLTRKQSS